ncbi:hypothetical protein D0Y65_025323 [Glycine soja]|uniref:Uncharacterized protein n=1 Tax=Glycine soja TaxID=3848 RepID=A0A445J6E6_GLYSO|nr:hypothetical protein D0Y65_025323 [Glycine soja]
MSNEALNPMGLMVEHENRLYLSLWEDDFSSYNLNFRVGTTRTACSADEI